MAVIGSLVVAMKAQTAKFAKGMKRARGVLGRFAKGIPLLNRSVGGLAAGLGVAAAGGLAIFTGRSLKSLDALAKLSDELNISTEILAGLGFAARITGTSFKVLEKGLKRFTRTVGEGKLGIGEGVEFLKLLGVTAEEIKDIPAGDLLFLFADAVAGTEDAAKRAALLAEGMGRAGQDLASFFMQGAGGLRAFIKEAGDLGITFSREELARIEEANDSMRRLATLGQGLADAFAIQIAPAIVAGAEALSDFIKRSKGSDSVVMTFIRRFLQGFGNAIDALGVFKSTFQLVLGTIQGSIGLMIVVMSGIPLALQTVINDIRGALGKSKVTFASAGLEFGKSFIDTGKETIKKGLKDLEKSAELGTGKRLIGKFEKASAALDARLRAGAAKREKDRIRAAKVRAAQEAIIAARAAREKALKERKRRKPIGLAQEFRARGIDTAALAGGQLAEQKRTNNLITNTNKILTQINRKPAGAVAQ